MEIAECTCNLDDMIDLYNSFHIMEALPARWSTCHLYKCSCKSGLSKALCWHAVLAGMICDPSIQVPVQYVHAGFQGWRKRGCPFVKKGDEDSDLEDETAARVRTATSSGYKVPKLCIDVWAYWIASIY